MVLPQDLQAVLAGQREVIIPESREELLEIAMGGKGCDNFEVAYDIPGKGRIVEATVSRGKNGAVVNYKDPYMRRRDPDCMLIADHGVTDKQQYSDKFGTDFSSLREATFDWLGETDLILMPFFAGRKGMGCSLTSGGTGQRGLFCRGIGRPAGIHTCKRDS